MNSMASQNTGDSIVYSTICSGADQRKHQSSASLAFVSGIEFFAQKGSNAENVSIWWRHHVEDEMGEWNAEAWNKTQLLERPC